jgi:hypothetical protein
VVSVVMAVMAFPPCAMARSALDDCLQGVTGGALRQSGREPIPWR